MPVNFERFPALLRDDLWPTRSFAQCRARPSDAAWPTREKYIVRTSSTKTARDVLRLLGGRRVTLVGASLMAQLHEAVLCALVGAGVDLRAADEQWSFSRMDVYTADKLHGAAGAPLRRRLAQVHPAAPVHARACEELLNATDVLILGLNPSHYKGDGCGSTTSSMRRDGSLGGRVAAPRRHLARAGAQPLPQRRVRSDGRTAARRPQRAAAGRWRFCASNEARGSSRARLRIGARAFRWLNETLPRHDAHKSDACRFDSPKVDGLHPNPGRSRGTRNSTGRPVRSCCDCVHFCYSPLFYDAVFFTPLHQILSEALK